MKQSLLVLSLLVILVFPSACPASAESLAAKGLARLQAGAPACPDSVDFVVCADPQPGSFTGTPKVFLEMINEWNLLKPDLVMCVGDMIMGGPASEVGAMWDEFLGRMDTLNMPLFPAAGNHDVNDEPEVLRIYEERVAPFNYTVARGDILFVVLNTEEPGDPDGFSQAQRDWLRETLAASTAKHIFLFLHVPLFAGNWERDWQPTADILRGYPVRAVFAGHAHYYRDYGVKDGVRYVIAGSAGGGLDEAEEEGGFFCYLWVRVRGDEVSWSVIKPGAVAAADVVTQDGVERLRSLRQMLAVEPVSPPWNEPFDRDVKVTLDNPFASPLETVLYWTAPPGWEVAERQIPVKVPAGESFSVQTRMRNQGPLLFPTPVAESTVVNPDTGEQISLKRMLDVAPAAPAPKAVGSVTLDGDLSEWIDAPVLPMRYGANYDPADTADLKATTRLMWDEEHLYVAVEVEDNEFHQPYYGDVVWMADSVELWIEKSNWSFSLTSKGPQVFLDERPDKHLDAVVGEVPLAAVRTGNRVVYEAAYPAAEVPHIALKSGTTVAFSILVNDLDPSGPLEKRHYAELTPGAGEHFACPKYKITFIDK